MDSEQQQQQQEEEPAPLTDENEFKESLQRWIQLDTYIATQNQELKQFRNERSALTAPLTRFMETHDLHNTVINTEEHGKISYVTESSYSSYTQKYLSDTLCLYFNNDKEKAADCLAFLKSNRVLSKSTTLKRTMPSDKT